MHDEAAEQSLPARSRICSLAASRGLDVGLKLTGIVRRSNFKCQFQGVIAGLNVCQPEPRPWLGRITREDQLAIRELNSVPDDMPFIVPIFCVRWAARLGVNHE